MKIGSCCVRPVDVVVGDIDDVIVVPRKLAEAVLLRAEEILPNEKQIFGWVTDGESVQSITAKGGHF